jgi:hypothetical protein
MWFGMSLTTFGFSISVDLLVSLVKICVGVHVVWHVTYQHIGFSVSVNLLEALIEIRVSDRVSGISLTKNWYLHGVTCPQNRISH